MQKTNKNANLLGLMMVLSIMSQEAITVPVYGASDITGVTGSNGTYDIRPDLVKNDTGFKHYNNFKLQKDDIANLIFNKGSYSKFVNLVDNRIYINGILNTLGNDGSFYNGHAIFVSPNGMVVGASGVLNVGSLTAISPNATSYLKYLGYSMGESLLDKVSDELQEKASAIKIQGITDEVNLKLLKEADQWGDINIQGKIFARDSVELVGKNINIGNEKDNRAAIFAGIPKDKQVKMTTIAQANNLFDALVTNNIEKGAGFGTDTNGNIIIKAQSIKQAELAAPDSLVVKGVSYTADKLFELVDGEIKVKADDELARLGLTVDDVKNAYELTMKTLNEIDSADTEGHSATVSIKNSVLAGKNVDVNAVSKVSYTDEKGASLFDRMVNTISDGTGSSVAENLLDNIVSSNVTFTDFEGSRATASVEVGENSTLYATKNVDLKSLATAETAVKIRPFKNPKLDTTSEGFYYLGTKTDSSVIVKSSAELIAGEDVNIIAASKNSLNVKVKNPTSLADATAGELINAPSVQVSFLQAVTKAETKAEVQNGAVIKAGNDVNVTASNFTSDQIVLESIANVVKPTDEKQNAGIAVAVTLKNTDINTSSTLDGDVTAGKTDKNGNVIAGDEGNVNVNAQNMHVAYTSSKTKVEKGSFAKAAAAGKISKKVTEIIGKKISGIQEGLDAITSVGSNLPSASVALVVNDTNVNSTAKIGKNAKINASHDVNVDSTIVDMSVNNTSGKLKIPEIEDSSKENSSYVPSSGVSVIVNNQNNKSIAMIEDGNALEYAKINAGNDIKVNATTEQPMNDIPFEIALNFTQAGLDSIDFANETSNQIFGFDKDSDWDLRLLVESLKTPADELSYDISNVLFGLKNIGASTLGLKGLFNNWAEVKSNNPNAIGITAAVVVSDVLNDTNARIGHYADLYSNNTIVNAANHVVQFNAAGDVLSLIGKADTKGESGIGGSVIVESVDSRANAEIGDNAKVIATNDVGVNSANDQDFLTLAVTGTQATSNNAIAIAGSTVVQDVKGKTIASVGNSTIDAKNLNVEAGNAKISKVPTAIEELKKDLYDIDSERFDVGLEEDFSIGEIRKFTETDFNLNTDSDLGFADDDSTSIGVLTGSGLAELKDAEDINDAISNMIITGSLVKQKQTDASEGTTASTGLAVGASVNVSEFSRQVDAFINDGANIKLAESLNVIANSKTESLNLALAGAFAGGAKLKGEPTSSKVDKYLTKAKGLLSKVSDIINSGDDSPKETGALDEKGNPKLSYKGVEYVTDLNGQYYDPKTGTVLKDSSGNPIKADNSLKTSSSSGSSSESDTKLNTSLNNKKNPTSSISGALAGSVNVQINDSIVSAKIGNANISVGKDVNVEANQKTSTLNIGTGFAKAGTVGAGAAVNMIQNSNKTLATIDGANIDFIGDKHSLNVLANEDNDNVQVAVGVGAAASSDKKSVLSAAVGGSFNVDLLTNAVEAEIKNSTIENLKTENEKDIVINSIAVNVDAENHSTSFKGAGGLSLSKSNPNATGVGASVAGNINAINKTTKAVVDNSTIIDTSSVKVLANSKKDAKNNVIPTEEIIDVSVAGAVIAGTAKTGFDFDGALSTNVVKSTIVAQVSGSEISSSGNVGVIANNYHKNWNAAGALGFSTATKGAGVGVGAIVNVLNDFVHSGIENSEITTAKTVDVNSYNKDDLNFIAMNMGIQLKGSTVDANGIVITIKNNISANVVGSSLLDTEKINVLSDNYADIFGVTGVGSFSAGNGVVVGANVLSNTLLSTNIASIEKGSIALENPTVESDGMTSVKATSDETINVTPVAMAATVSGVDATAANVGVNVVSNTTKAYIDGVEITSNGIDVNAQDNTTSQTRGGVLAVSGSGTAALGGSVLSDTYVKDVQAYISESTIEKGGDIKVSASAKNIFGAENPNSITASGIANSISSNTYDVSEDVNMQDWDMTYDVAGSSTSAISGSIISKVVANDIKSYIGENTTIKDANTLNVAATNTINTSVIAGNVSGASTAAVGGNIFSNVNTSKVNAEIENGVVVEKVGNVDVSAISSQINRSITFTASGAGTASVAGAVNSNIIVNETNAHIGETAQIKSNGNITVKATDSVDKEGIFAAVAAASGASVGDVIDVNVFNNKVSSQIGTSDEVTAKDTPTISAKGNILLDAAADENYKANVIMVAGSGTAAVGAVAISNTMASDVKSGIQGVNIKSEAGQIDVNAKNSFNEKNKKQTTGLKNLLSSSKDIDTEDLKTQDLIPLVAVLNVSGSGTGVAVQGTVVNNNVISTVDSYVKNAIVDSEKGLNLSAISQMTTYDAVMGVGANGVGASVALNGIVNTYSGTTTANIDKSTISGNVGLNAEDKLNLNSLIFAVSANGVGASVIPVVNTNTIANDVLAKITNSTIKNASTVSVLANNIINITDGVVAGSGNEIGTATNVVPITNVFTGRTKAYVDNSKINVNSDETTVEGNPVATNVEAGNDINNVSAIVGLSGNGIGAAVGGYAMTNVFDNDLESYIKNSAIGNAKSTLVKSNSDLDMNSLLASGSANGIGAGVIVNSAVNVIKNNVDSYIDASSITGGSIDVKAIQKADVTSNSAGISGNGIGNATAVNSLVNVFTNNLNAYILDTSTTNASDITVSTDADETLNNTNIGVSFSGTAATGANSIVNVLENNSKTYIDAKSKTINATGEVKVSADDTLIMSNLMGMATGSGFVAAGANVNVNVINNAVKAELLNSTGGKVEAGSIDVGATSTMSLDEKFSSASLGLVGISGNVIINSIGSKVDTSNSELNGANISGTLSSANSTYNNNVKDISYTKDNKTKTIQNEYSLTGNSSTGRGTIANVNANITSQGEVSVHANNTVKGIGSDTLRLSNVVASAGSKTAGASVLVNDINYNTSAQITGGSVSATDKKVKVTANSQVKADISAEQATISAKGIGGNVGYTNNSAVTQAIISNTKVDSGNLDVNATSLDSINVNVVSKAASGASANVSVSVAETNNKVNAGILGNVGISANNIKIIADNTSSLKSENDAMLISGANYTTSVNRAKSNAVTQALIDATGSIVANNDLSTIAQSGGIDSIVTMNLGSVTLAGASATSNGASVSSSFKAGIDNTKFDAKKPTENTLSITSGTTNIKSGVLSSDNTNATTVKANVLTDKSSASLLSASATNLSATVDVDSTAISNANSHTSGDVSIVSKADRKASVESSTNSLGAVSLDVLGINSTVEGTNTITVGGSHTVKGKLDIDLVDASTTNTEMVNAEITLASATASSSSAVIDTDTTIDFGGNVLANDVDILSDVTRTSNNSLDSKGAGLVSVKNYKFKTETAGETAINISAKMINPENATDLYANNLSVTSQTDNIAESILSSKSEVLVALSKELSENVVSSKNNINFTNAEINSTGAVKASVDDNNITSMKKDSESSGVVVYIAGDLKNAITQNSGINIQDSKIYADSITMQTKSTLDNINEKDKDKVKVNEITYKLRNTDVTLSKTKATINNVIAQNAKINLANAKLIANDDVDIDVITSSNFAQSVTNEGQGFIAKSNADSILTVTNNNDLVIDENSALSGNNVNISLDSNNTLKSEVKVKVSHVGGLDPVGKADLTLNINNNIKNIGSIKGGDSVQIDFMKNSKNNLTQSSDVEVQAAIATAESKGVLTYNVNNKLDVAKITDKNQKIQYGNITSAKDVIVNYSAGQNKLSSNIRLKKIHRILFGIPIVKEKKSQNIEQKVTNSLNLDGEIIAGTNARRYMLIDKNGDIDTAQIKGFLENEYKIVNADTLSGEELTAETKAALQSQIAEYDKKIKELQAEKGNYATEIEEYEANISILEKLQTYLNNVTSTITEENVAAALQNEVKKGVVFGNGENATNNPNKMSETVFNGILEEYNDSEVNDLRTFLTNYVVTPEQKDNKGNVTQAEVKLTSGQIDNFLTVTENVKNEKFEEYIIGKDVYAKTYDGNLIIQTDNDLADLKLEVKTSLNSLNSHKSALQSYTDSIDSQIADYNTQKTANQNQIDYLTANPLDGYTIAKSSIQFENLMVQPSKIELNGIENTSITGTGKFRTYSPDFVIDNYSNKDLIFKTIDMAASSSSGLFINGESYADYMNSKYAVNEAVKNTQTDGVLYKGDNNTSNNITINNYYDSLNSSSEVSAIASDIIFNGYINTPNKFEVFNDSGDINFANSITAKSKNIVSTQGCVVYNAPNSTLILQADDQILAGENVDIIAKVIKVGENAKIKAGYAQRSITITDDMLANLVVDPTTGKTNMIDLAGNNKSAYLNETNNIKALYDDGKILLFDTKQEGGNVKLTGSVEGNGTVYYTNGYANVKIDNQTSAKLFVNSLENNRMDGVATANNTALPSTITVVNQAVSNVDANGKNIASTEVKSKNLIKIIGSIFNGKNKSTDDGTSKLVILSEEGVNVDKKSDELGNSVATIDAVGDVEIKNTASAVNVEGVINVADGNLNINNTGTDTTISSAIKNESGNITVANKNGKLELSGTGSITNKNGNTTLINEGSSGTEISGVIANEVGNISLTNNAGELLINSSITANNGNITAVNNGEGGATFTANAKVNANGDNSIIEITNTNGGISVAEGAEIVNNSQTSSDNVKISNSGKGLLSFFGSIFNKKGNTVIENTNVESGVLVSTTGIIKNEEGNISLSNNGSQGIKLEGKIENNKGNTAIENTNAQSGVLIATTGIIKNEEGNISLSNNGSQDIKVEGKIENEKGNITVSIENSDLVIGEYASDNDNYISAKNGNVIINQINGSILNGIVDEGNVGNNQNHDLGNIDKAYKTLINSNGNLAFNIQNGNVGSDTHALSGKESGFGVNASTRDYTESINVKVAGSVSANAENNDLFNLRAKDSNLNIDAITTDGNVMITAVDWKQADIVPTPDEETYFHGYSVVNSSTDNSKANITGKNISIVASDNIGSDGNRLTYNQLANGSISAMAENDVNISGLGGKDTIWQLISKRGNLDFTLNGDAEIREITAGDKLKITSKGQNLTIYDLGKISSMTTGDDILYPHDGISFDNGDVTPEQLELKVIGENSTLNIFNAYVKGSDNGKADVILRADNIIAHAYDAPSSIISTVENPNGFDAKAGRTYADDITNENAPKDLKASGFNTVGDGGALTFDIQGVSKDDVIAAGGDVNSRDYNLQDPVSSPKPEFQNPNAFTNTVAKADNVSISVNSGENSPTDNRGMTIEKLYADNAYVDTKDLNLKAIDTFITDYGEFRNGNREATTGGYPISDDYRWINIVDNDYKRNLSNIYGIPVTSQIYTDKTGSFSLNMGDLISQNTKAPIVSYNPNNTISNPDTENSFFRLTYKDNKIQYVTTTPDFEEIDKSTYLPNKREFIRFAVLDDDGMVQVSDKKSLETPRIISVKDISRGGLLVVHDGSLKMKEKFSINLTYNDISTNVEVEVVRLGANSQAGLKFINMDKATANKILHMNMSLQANKDVKVKISCN